MIEAGEMDRAKSASVRFPLPLRVIPLLVPLTGILLFPAKALLATLRVNVDVAEPFAGGVTGCTVKLPHVIPVGMGVPQDRVTAPLNPLMLVTVTFIAAALEPKFTVAGLTVTEKSWTIKVAVAVCVRVPTVPVTVKVKFPLVVGVTVSMDDPGQVSGLTLKLPPRLELNCTGPLKLLHVIVNVAD